MTRTVVSARQPITNQIRNYNFENVPTFVAATTSNTKWIDGTATGSTNSDAYGWGIVGAVGTRAAQYDQTVFHSGAASLKVSVTATGSLLTVGNSNNANAAGIIRYAIPVLPSTSYTVSGWMKTNLVSGSSTNGARIYINLYTGAGAFSQTKVVTNSVLTTTNWTFYTATFSTTATQVFALTVCEVSGNSGAATLIMDAWFDNIKLDLTSGTSRTVVV